MEPLETTEKDRRGRQLGALVLGVASALSLMGVAYLTIRWPAPGISALLGYAVYRLARGRRE